MDEGDQVMRLLDALPGQGYAIAAGWACVLLALQWMIIQGYVRSNGTYFATLWMRGGPRRILVHLLKGPSTIAHELAHVVMCILTRTPMGKIVPWWPTETEDGVRFGYVSHSPWRDWRGAIVALAPGLLVPGALLAISRLLVGEWLPGIDALAEAGWQRSALWIAAMALIASGAFPSSEDFVLIKIWQWLSLAFTIALTAAVVVLVGGPQLGVTALASIVLLLLPTTILAAVYLGLLALYRQRLR